ncbi:MAG TPA: FliA/WhiG family RNA polymerase sigma factor [Acidimicrobiales bacterium]
MSTTKIPGAQRDLTAVIEQHLPLVEHVVYQVAINFPRHVDREELARAGAIGLIEAAQRYDGSRGVPFDRFAAQRIRGAILDAVRAADWAPRSLRQASRTLESARQDLTSRIGRQPTDEELAGELGMDLDKLCELRQRVHRAVVLALDDRVLSDEDEDLSLADVLCDRTSVDPCDELENRELHAFLRDAIQLLPDRHRSVIVGYFFEGSTSQELAADLGVTESRVSQLRSEAFEMMREGIEAQFPDIDRAPAEAPEPKGRVARRKVAYASAIAANSSLSTRLDPVRIVERSRDSLVAAPA